MLIAVGCGAQRDPGQRLILRRARIPPPGPGVRIGGSLGGLQSALLGGALVTAVSSKCGEYTPGQFPQASVENSHPLHKEVAVCRLFALLACLLMLRTVGVAVASPKSALLSNSKSVQNRHVIHFKR